MGTLKVRCCNCTAVYEVTPDCIYPAEKMEEKHIYPWECPHCRAEMSKQLWNKLVEAFWAFEEINRDLRSDGESYDTPILQAEYKMFYVPRGKMRV